MKTIDEIRSLLYLAKYLSNLGYDERKGFIKALERVLDIQEEE